jgi:hypothetical protein
MKYAPVDVLHQPDSYPNNDLMPRAAVAFIGMALYEDGEGTAPRPDIRKREDKGG